jgi:hypothetical protein
MNTLDANATTHDHKIEYSFSLTEEEIKTRQRRRIITRIGAVFLLLALAYGIYLIWTTSMAMGNKIGILALLAFLGLYLVRFLITPIADPVSVENILVIDALGIALNNTFVEWELIDKVELKNRRDGKYLEISSQYKRDAYTAPVQNYLFVWQIERYGDVGEILAEIEGRLKASVN